MGNILELLIKHGDKMIPLGEASAGLAKALIYLVKPRTKEDGTAETPEEIQARIGGAVASADARLERVEDRAKAEIVKAGGVLALLLVLSLSTACSALLRPPVGGGGSVGAGEPVIVEPVVVPAPVAILTVEVEPKAATVHVANHSGDAVAVGAYPTRPNGQIVEEFYATPGAKLRIWAQAPGYLQSETVELPVAAGPLPVVRIVLKPEPKPEWTPITAAVKFPAVCASYYASPTDPDLDVARFAEFLRSVGVTCSRAWLLDAWAIGERDISGRFLQGQYDGLLPVQRSSGAGLMVKELNGEDVRPFDLDAWNGDYFDRLRRYVEILNSNGVWPHLTLVELYSWSDRKASLPFVPNVNKNPLRHNINGVRWGGPDDPTLFAMPDAWLSRFACKVVETLAGTAYAWETGNEFPEKDAHFRIAETLRGCGWAGEITTNRNEDAPGQFWNMQVGGRLLSRIAFHNFLDMGYLDVEYPREAEAGRPTTFRKMWDMVDPARVIVSSDGGGGNPVHLPALKAVACDALRRGGSYEHQLALKRRRFFGDGSLNMADLEIDRAFLREVVACKPAG